MGKTKRKKLPDTRGYATTSIASTYSGPSAREEISNSVSAKSAVTKTSSPSQNEAVNTTESSEKEVDCRDNGHLATELSYLQRITSKSLVYKGSLYPQTKMDCQVSFVLPFNDFLERLLSFLSCRSFPPFAAPDYGASSRMDSSDTRTCSATSLVCVPRPRSWVSTVWSYERASRVLHALEGSGIDLSVARAALLGSRGLDERAAAEFAVERFAEKLPSTWCSLKPTTTGNGSSEAQRSLTEDASVSAGTGAAAKAKSTTMTADELALKTANALRVEKQKFDALARAKSLVIEVQRENDELMYRSQDSKKKSKSVPPSSSPTSQYRDLAARQTELKSVLKLLDKKDKKLLSDRINTIGRDMADLSPDVEFARLKQQSKSEAGANNSEGVDDVAESEKVDFATNGMASMTSGDDGEDTVLAVLTVDSLDNNKKNDEEEEEEENNEDCDGGMFGLFENADEEAVATTTGDGSSCGIADSKSTAPDEKSCVSSLVYEFKASRGLLSPQRLLSTAVSDTTRFSAVSSGYKRCRQQIEIGPLPTASAKQLNRAKGSFLTATPGIDSVNEESAKELASLLLLFDLTPSDRRMGVKGKLQANSSSALLWQQWMTDEAEKLTTELKTQAKLRVEAVEQSLCNPEDIEQNIAAALTKFPKYATTLSSSTTEMDTSSKRNNNNGRGGHHQRPRTTPLAVHEELEKRRKWIYAGGGDGAVLPNAQAAAALDATRLSLPTNQFTDELMQLITSNDVSIICGETGCGKSTQCPQIILREQYKYSINNTDTDVVNKSTSHDFINIIVTEPRRLATVSVSTRVSAELGDSNSSSSANNNHSSSGRDGAALCGYTVRLDSNVGPKCVLEYVTNGVLLKRIQSTHGECLKTYSHVVVDEVHERSVDSDLLLLLLREYRVKHKREQQQPQQPHQPHVASASANNASTGTSFPRVVLMSATADTEALLNYWKAPVPAASGGSLAVASITAPLLHDEDDSISVAMMHIPGRTFPVTAVFLEDTLESSNISCESLQLRNSCDDDDNDVASSMESRAYSDSNGGGNNNGNVRVVDMHKDKADGSSTDVASEDDEDSDDDDDDGAKNLQREIESSIRLLGSANDDACTGINGHNTYSTRTLDVLRQLDLQAVNYELLIEVLRHEIIHNCCDSSDHQYNDGSDNYNSKSKASGTSLAITSDNWEDFDVADSVKLRGAGISSGSSGGETKSNVESRGEEIDRVSHDLAATAETRSTSGAIIVFMPGLAEIRRLISMVEADKELSAVCTSLAMHSSLSSEDLQRAFQKDRYGKRKLIVSTNICETGVTIDDVDLVVDAGFVKSMQWNEVTETAKLRMHRCSVAEALQRKGRAGRVRPGRCVHVYPRWVMTGGIGKAVEGTEGSQSFATAAAAATSSTAVDAHRKQRNRLSMQLQPDPEMKRAPLASPILSLAAQGLRPGLLLSAVGQTVAVSKLENTIGTLVELGAILRAKKRDLTASVAAEEGGAAGEEDEDLDEEENENDDDDDGDKACNKDGAESVTTSQSILTASGSIASQQAEGQGGNGQEQGQQSSNDKQTLALESYRVTPLGEALSRLPCDPRSGKILLAAHRLDVLHAACVFVASLDVKSVFIRDKFSDSFFMNQYGKRTSSDAVAVVNAYSEWVLNCGVVTGSSGNSSGSSSGSSSVGGADGRMKYWQQLKWCNGRGISLPAMEQLAATAKDLMSAVLEAVSANTESKRNNSLLSAKAFNGTGDGVESVVSNSKKKSITCLTCSSGVGMHSCVTGSNKDCLHAAIAAGVGHSIAFRSSSSNNSSSSASFAGAAAAAISRPYYKTSSKQLKACHIHRSSLVTEPWDLVAYCTRMVTASGSQSLQHIVPLSTACAVLFAPWKKSFLGDGTLLLGRGVGVQSKAQTLVIMRKMRYLWDHSLVSGGEEELISLIREFLLV